MAVAKQVSIVSTQVSRRRTPRDKAASATGDASDAHLHVMMAEDGDTATGAIN
eukprot:m.1082380 g.1082380  ORF g.1082380 m.1082380 type:complete len:53 (-) comp24265_c0_seq4:91-249(-)